MKTLVLFGSPRPRGSTHALVRAFLEEALGEVHFIDAYKKRDIQPCLDCRSCWKRPRCVLNDGMGEIYQYTEESDRILLASPVYFNAVPAPLKTILDRYQPYWASRHRGDRSPLLSKRGALLLTGGAPTYPDQFTGSILTLKGVLSELRVECSGIITAPHTDRFPLGGEGEKLTEARALARSLYRGKKDPP